MVARQQLKPLLGLLALLMIWWLLPPFVSRITKSSFYEFQAPFTTAASHTKDLQKYWGMQTRSKQNLIKDGRDLARLNASYSLNNQQLLSAQKQVARLEAILALPAEPKYRYEVARVTKRNLTAWWQQIIIRKGENYGIPVGAAVVFSEGVVGRVREVNAYTSVVELISSPGFRMAANIEGEDRPITYQGLPNKPLAPPIGEVLNVPPNITATQRHPKRLVSSRLGGVFPEGLLIGEITALEPGSDGYFQRGKVHLNSKLINLHEVAIVIPVEQEISPKLTSNSTF